MGVAGVVERVGRPVVAVAAVSPLTKPERLAV